MDIRVTVDIWGLKPDEGDGETEESLVKQIETDFGRVAGEWGTVAEVERLK